MRVLKNINKICYMISAESTIHVRLVDIYYYHYHYYYYNNGDVIIITVMVIMMMMKDFNPRDSSENLF
jgi:predicted Zn-dependent protease